MKTLYFLLFVMLSVFSISLKAQNSDNKQNFDIRVGGGVAFLGTGDMLDMEFETELNYKFIKFLAVSASLNFGREAGDRAINKTAAFIQGILTLYVSPFRNNRLNDFRIGFGMTVYNISDSYLYSKTLLPDGSYCHEYVFDKRTSFGGNFVIEDTFTIKNKFLLGAKVFLQPFVNSDIASGGLLKVGYKL
jgi:hypothetical protein